MMGPFVKPDMPNAYADSVGLIAFSHAMAAKLRAKSRQGRGGWHRPDECSIDDLRRMLVEHVEKGDPIDIANFAMMIWNRREMAKDKKAG